MKLADLSPETRRRIEGLRFDRIVEKHEGPFEWRYWLDKGGAEFLVVDGASVLLPVEQEQHPNITIVRSMMSADGQTITLFLTDTTYFTDMDAGFMAVCERVPDEDWYIALVFHEWFVIEDVATQYRSLT